MTIEETKELIADNKNRIAVMQAYVDGKQIQYFEECIREWEDILAHNGRVIGHVVDGVRGYCFDVVYADPVSTSTWSLYGVVVNDYKGDVEIVGNIHDNQKGG